MTKYSVHNDEVYESRCERKREGHLRRSHTQWEQIEKRGLQGCEVSKTGLQGSRQGLAQLSKLLKSHNTLLMLSVKQISHV